MRAKLPPANEDRDYAAEFDMHLGVGNWRAPGRRQVRAIAPREPGAPAWWQGDEEASQSFLMMMGAHLG